jgi:hypothetical protein
MKKVVVTEKTLIFFIKKNIFADMYLFLPQGYCYMYRRFSCQLVKKWIGEKKGAQEYLILK